MKKLHKAAIATVMATMMLSSVSPVLAAGDATSPQAPVVKKPTIPAGVISEQKALEVVTQFFGKEVLATLGEPHVSFNESSFMRNKPEWFVSFYQQSKEGQIEGNSLYASVDAITGQIYQFNYQNKDWTGKNMATKDVAVPAAEEFLKTKRPDLYAKLKVNSWSGGGGTGMQTPEGGEITWMYRSVRFTEMVNGVPFLTNTVSVDVDEYGHVVGMNDQMIYDSSKLPPLGLALPLSKATKMMSDQMIMDKQYTTTSLSRTESGEYKLEERPVLGYRPRSLSPFNAITGKPVEQMFPIRHEDKQEQMKLTGTGKNYVVKSTEEAKSLIADLLKVDLSKLMFREEKNSNPVTGRQIWYLSGYPLSEESSGVPNYINAAFDAQTGEVLSVSAQNQYDAKKVKPVLSLSEARQKAVEVLKSQLSLGEHEVFLMSEVDGSKQQDNIPKWVDRSTPEYEHHTSPDFRYVFQFALGHQGVPVADQNYYVQFDAVTGELAGLSVSNVPADLNKLPDNKTTISAADAKSKFLGEHQLQLAYVWPQFMWQSAPEGQLIYQFAEGSVKLDYIDALTGEIVNRQDDL